MTSYTLPDASAHLGEIADEAVATHEPVVITRPGRPAVVVMSAEDLADLEDGLRIAQNRADRAAGRVTGTVIRSEADIDAAIDAYEAANA
jgi:prevent-host-death family protein